MTPAEERAALEAEQEDLKRQLAEMWAEAERLYQQRSASLAELEAMGAPMPAPN